MEILFVVVLLWRPFYTLGDNRCLFDMGLGQLYGGVAAF